MLAVDQDLLVHQSPARHLERIPPTESRSELRRQIWTLRNFPSLNGGCFWIVSQFPTFPPRSIAAPLRPSHRSKTCISNLPMVSAVSPGLTRPSSTQASEANEVHPPFSSRAQGRVRSDGNREVLAKPDDWVASTHRRRRCSASAKSRPSPRPRRAYSRANRNVAHLALDSSRDPAQPAACSSSTDSPEGCSNNSGRSRRLWSMPSPKEHSS